MITLKEAQDWIQISKAQIDHVSVRTVADEHEQRGGGGPHHAGRNTVLRNKVSKRFALIIAVNLNSAFSMQGLECN